MTPVLRHREFRSGKARFRSGLGLVALIGWIAGGGGGELRLAGAEVKYVVTALGTLGGGSSSGEGINENGQVVGTSVTSNGDTRAFLWTRGGADGPPGNPPMRDLGTLGGPRSYSYAVAVNDDGQVTGVSTVTNVMHAFRHAGGVMEDLGFPYLDVFNINSSEGRGINASGHITGVHQTLLGRRAFLYTGPGSVLDLGTLGGFSSYGTAINDRGQVAGASAITGGVSHPFLWAADGTNGPASNPRMEDLGTLLGGSGNATCINSDGQVAGHSDQHAFLWTRGGTDGPAANPRMRDLGTLNETSYSYASGINDHGHVVGWSLYGPNDDFHAFLHREGALTDLNTLIPADSGWELMEAHDINNRGQIVGRGMFRGQSLGFLLTPIATKSLYAVLLGQNTGGIRGLADAELVQTALRRFPGVKLENLSVVTSGSEVQERVLQIRDTIQPGDSFIFFYSGHSAVREDGSEPSVPYDEPRQGHPLNTGDEYLAINGLAFDAAGADFLTDDDLKILFGLLPREVRKLAILATCFSGGHWGQAGRNQGDFGDLDKVPNSALLAAAGEGGKAYGFLLGGMYFSASVSRVLNQIANTKASFSFADLQSELATVYVNGNFPSEGVVGDAEPWLGTDNLPVENVGPLLMYSAATEDFDVNASWVPEPEPGKLLSSRAEGDYLHLGFATAAKQSYTVEGSLNLAQPIWVDVTNVIGNGSIMTVALPLGESAPQRFFRLRRP